MRDSIIVKLSELRSVIQDARRTGKQYVQLSILDSLDDSNGNGSIPAELSITAFDSTECIEFESICAPQNEAELDEHILNAVHISSNLL